MHKKDMNHKFNCYAKILVFVAIAFLIYGIFLNYDNAKLLGPIFNSNDDVKYTSVDIHNDKVKVKTNSNKNDELKNGDLNNRIEYYESLYDKDEENNDLRKNIMNTYNIDIKYGPETFGYEVGGMEVVPIDDSYEIGLALNKLNSALSLYPDGFFDEIRNGGIPLTIYLIDEFSIAGVTGVTDSNNYFANIVIAIQYSFEETFFHESYHYIERYMFKKGLNFNSWNNYNPVNFRYDKNQENAIHSYSYNRVFTEDAFFVNDYAQTDAGEDRASTFEYMMDTTKASCLNKGKPIWKKAKLISNTIEATFKSVSSSEVEYWERYL